MTSNQLVKREVNGKSPKCIRENIKLQQIKFDLTESEIQLHRMSETLVFNGITFHLIGNETPIPKKTISSPMCE